MKIKKGMIIRTPRFLNVEIQKVFNTPEEMYCAGYTEPTHFFDDEYEIAGRSIDMYHMEFAAARK